MSNGSTNVIRPFIPDPIETGRITIAVLGGTENGTEAGSPHLKGWREDKALKSYQFQTVTADTIGDVAKTADLILLDLRGFKFSIRSLNRLIVILTNIPPSVLLIADASTSPAHLKRLTPFTKIIVAPFSNEQLSDRIGDLLRQQQTRLSTHRLKALLNDQERGTEHPRVKWEASTQEEILVAGAPGSLTLSLINIFQEAGLNVQCAYRPAQAIRILETSKIAGALFVSDGNKDPLFALSRAMRRHSRHRIIPVIHVDQNCLGEPLDATNRPAIPAALAPDFAVEMMRGEIFQMRELEMFREECTKIGTQSVREPRARVWSPQILARWLETVGNECDRASKLVPMLGINVRCDEATNLTSHKILEQIGPKIASMVRAGDFISVVSATPHSVTCAVGLPSIPQSRLQKSHLETTRIGARIKGNFRNTSFQDNIGNPTSFSTHHTAFIRPKGLRVEETVAALLRQR